MIVDPPRFLVKLFDKQFAQVKPVRDVGRQLLTGHHQRRDGGSWCLGHWTAVPPRHRWLGTGVEKLVSHHAIPLASIIVEPAKVLFLNNAINHGVLGPLGVEEALDKGKSIMFMIETNPGPGLGILLAYWFFGPRALRPTVPAAIIIQFLGGIHEIYFPVRVGRAPPHPRAIAGGMSGVAIFWRPKVGLVCDTVTRFDLRLPRRDTEGQPLGVLLGVTAGLRCCQPGGLRRLARFRTNARRCPRPRGRSRAIGRQQAGLEADPGRRVTRS